jgi:uncharacterized repeat protein (TIGR01451 family)
MGTKGAIIGLILIMLLALSPAAFGMTSTNYDLWPSDTNSGGGSRSSTSYTVGMDTVGQGVTGGALSSTGYNLESGLLMAMGGDPDISVLPTSWDFASIWTGYTSGTQTFTVSNDGTEDLVIGTAFLNGTTPAEFIISSDGCSGQTVTAGNSCGVDVFFEPTSGGAKSANLVVPSNDLDTPELVINLDGTGIQAYTLTMNPNGGTGLGNVVSTLPGIDCGADCTEDYETGTNIELTATPDAGSTFVGWSGAGSGCVSGSANPCSFTIDTDTSITATFDAVGGDADVGVVAMADYQPVAAGEALIYLIDVTNNGPGTANDVSLSGALPPGTAYVSGTASQGSCIDSGGTVTCSFGTVSNGITVYADITVMPLIAKAIDFNVSVTTSSTDPNASNDSATANAAVYPTVFKADFDGDGKEDVAIYRPSNGYWFFTDESKSVVDSTQFGIPGDIPVPADYTGDGVTNVAVYRPSNGYWFITDKAKSFMDSVRFGIAGDIPVPGMYNGAAAGAEIAVYRPSNGWWFMTDRFGGYMDSVRFGIPGDIPLPADYTGDGKTDVAIYRPSNRWWFVTDKARSFTDSAQFGVLGDRPMPGDYDGVSGANIAVYRPSNGYWFISNMGKTFINGFNFGIAGDHLF